LVKVIENKPLKSEMGRKTKDYLLSHELESVTDIVEHHWRFAPQLQRGVVPTTSIAVKLNVKRCPPPLKILNLPPAAEVGTIYSRVIFGIH
jgi:hypothetical protein